MPSAETKILSTAERDRLMIRARSVRDGTAKLPRPSLQERGDMAAVLLMYEATVRALEAEQLLLAKLGAVSPQFFNPVEAWAATELRDKILNADAARSSSSEHT